MSSDWVTVLVVANSILLLAVTVAVLFLYRQWGAMLLMGSEGISTHHGLRVGSPAPALTGLDSTSGDIVKIQPRKEVLVFASSGCKACEEKAAVFRDLLVVQDEWPLRYVYQGKTAGELPEPLHYLLGSNRFKVLLESERSHEDYGVQVSPFVMVTDDSGLIASKGLVGGVTDLVQLLIDAGDSDLSHLRDELIQGRLIVDRDPISGEIITREVIPNVEGAPSELIN
ncbi:MAG: hypothetical protein ACR2L3_00465 [Actinomycetota bacterium]